MAQVRKQEPMRKTNLESLNDPKDIMLNMVRDYCNVIQTSLGRNKPELELRFRKNGNKPVTRIEYNRVIQHLLSMGFRSNSSEGVHQLRINNEYTTRDGDTRMSNIRAEIVGIDMIQEYIKSNNLQKLVDMPSTISYKNDKVVFTKKIPAVLGEPYEKTPSMVDFKDMNFRASYQTEQQFTTASAVGRDILSKWMDSKKTFRFMNRIQFTHPNYPFMVDLSVIRNSRTTNDRNRIMIPYYTIQESGVMEDTEHYEIELEFNNNEIRKMFSLTNINKQVDDKIMKPLYHMIRVIVGGVQDTNYPIGNTEQTRVLQEYMQLFNGPDYRLGDNSAYPVFIGPSSYTLQMENVIEIKPDMDISVPNIRNGYTVTDKADGERKLLYIGNNGRIYMIDTNLNVTFTGAITLEKVLKQTLIDGEYIKYNKKDEFINLYAAFDIYYVGGKSVRELEFMKTDPDSVNNKYRLLLLQNCIRNLLNPISEVSKESTNSAKGTGCNIRIRCKDFEVASDDKNIFECCSKLIVREHDGLYEYNTDGLIFTPIRNGVGGNAAGVTGPLNKYTWEHSFKWKPPQYNTVDFLVRVKKNQKTGKDETITEFNGLYGTKTYKTLILHCGYDERKHGYINPMQDMIDGKYEKEGNLDNDKNYKPMPFLPTNPSDKNACYCKIEVSHNEMMITEEHESFQENNIVEFRYDLENKNWIPLRVRYDKTAEFQSGKPNFGNAFHVADSNWNSIHHAITSEMLMGGEGFDVAENAMTEDEDTYYNRVTAETSTKALRDFHNKYVKRELITKVCRRNDTLIDYAVGLAGDLSKWITAKLRFVFGIDVHGNNITDRTNGACARYLNLKRKTHKMPGALFFQGNSKNNIRNGDAFPSDKNRVLAKALFGEGPKERRVLGDVAFEKYGIGSEGFSVSSCQFALHYFFETQASLHGFIRNLAECTHLGGYFIGTCYDGQTVFDKLQTRGNGDAWTIMKGGRKIFEMKKRYDETGFPDDEMSIGYAIDVYQESINKEFREYLVNFDYFVRLMEDYGFVLVPKDEAMQMNLPNGTGMFKDLYDTMMHDVKLNPRNKVQYGVATEMSGEEKDISFLNRYFVFKKMRSVNTSNISKLFMKESEQDKMAMEEDDEDEPIRFKLPKEELKEREGELEVEKKPEAAAVEKKKLKKIQHPKLNIQNYKEVENDIEHEAEMEADKSESTTPDFAPPEKVIYAPETPDVPPPPSPEIAKVEQPQEMQEIKPKRKYVRKPKLNIM